MLQNKYIIYEMFEKQMCMCVLYSECIMNLNNNLIEMIKIESNNSKT